VNRGRVAAWLVVACTSAWGGLVCLEACTQGEPASPGLGEDAAAEAAPYVCPEGGYPTCPSPPPSWKAEVQPIVDKWCGPCHLTGGSGIGKGGSYNYSTLGGFIGLVTIETDVHDCTMPLAGSPPLPTASWETLLQWPACCAPDN